jgi:putative flippase GtrA
MAIFLKIIEKAKRHAFFWLPNISRYLQQHKSVVKFFIAGGTAGMTDLILLYIFHGVFKMEIVLATSLAFIISFVVSFSLQKYWAFNNQDTEGVYQQFVLYLIIAFINLNINGGLMHIMVNKYQVWYLLSQVIVSLTIGVESFMIYKFIIFRNKKKQTNEINSEFEPAE